MNASDWNCVRDGSLASRCRPAGAGIKPPCAAGSRKGLVVSDKGKGAQKASGMNQGDERKRTADDASKSSLVVVKTGERSSSGTSPSDTCLRLGRRPVYRRHDLDSGSCMERGNLFSDEKGNLQAVAPASGNTDAESRGGAARSSDESPVIGEERRGCVIQPGKWDNLKAGRTL